MDKAGYAAKHAHDDILCAGSRSGCMVAPPAAAAPHSPQFTDKMCSTCCSAAAVRSWARWVLHPHLIGEVEGEGAQVQLLHQQQLLF